MLEIEMAVLGSLLLWYDDFGNTIESINEEDFTTPETKEIFNAIKKCETPNDTTIVISMLSSEAKAVAINSTDTIKSHDSYPQYLSRLKDFSNSRRIRERLTDVVFNRDELITAEKVKEIVESNETETLQPYAERAKKRLLGFAERETEKVLKIKTGIRGLDKLSGGFRIPAVSIVGALPSTGKTSFALNIASEQIIQGDVVVIFSLEMSFDMIYERLLCMIYQLDYNMFTTKNFSDRDKRTLEGFRETMANLNVYVFDDIYDVETQALICSQLKPKFVMVDYVQKVTSKEKQDSRRAEIEYISGKYKQIANKVGCHIMVLSQLSRGNDTTPTMRSLKESGSLEADGDYIMILNRPYVYNKEDYEPNETKLLLDKNKFGQTGLLNLYFEGQYQKFYEQAEEDSDY